jgi:hypothetical protein
MTKLKKTIAAIALLGAFTTPVFAEGPQEIEGKFTVYHRTGAIEQMTVTDKTMLDDITKSATPLPDNAMVVMHNGTFYLVQDHKMPNGKFISDMIHENAR